MLLEVAFPGLAASGAQGSKAEIGPLARSPGLASTGKAEESASDQVFQEARRHMGQSWDCSQIEDESEERDAMDALEAEDDEAMGRGEQGGTNYHA